MKLPTVLLETTKYLILAKPAGISVHADGKSEQYTIADWILEHYPQLAEVGEPMELHGKKVLRPGIVHRLDKDTTGCLLIAKNQETFLHFKKQFQEHNIKKIYHTFVYGAIKVTNREKTGVIADAIGRSRGDIRKWAIGKGARGVMRDAITEYTVLETIGSREGKGSTASGTFSFVECRPKTGRTHQIRVHMKSINHPIVCDQLYAEKRVEETDNSLGFKRLALHARELHFTDQNGQRVVVVAPYPADFEQALRSDFDGK
jgi:23S rRNA pseudouridine1911/1915/1917 synthase